MRGAEEVSIHPKNQAVIVTVRPWAKYDVSKLSISIHRIGNAAQDKKDSGPCPEMMVNDSRLFFYDCYSEGCANVCSLLTNFS